MKIKKNKKIWIYFSVITLFFILIILLFMLYPKKEIITSEDLDLELIAGGLVNPVQLTESSDSTGRLFIVDRIGLVKIINSEGNLIEEPFLDLREKMVELKSTFDERGLLGLAFHPDFENNKKFYVYYSSPLRVGGPEGWDHTSRISEFKVSDNLNKTDVNSEKIILEIDEPQFNHDGGQLIFGKDNYLYISVGDGGNADDVGLGHSDIGNGQDTETLLGKILRIDIEKNPYGIPSDNPFVGKDGRDEIYAYGLRNPFRMSFDEQTGRLFAGDVGQNLWEEIDIIEKGKNYGWNIKEGIYCFSTENPDESPAECSDKGYNEEELISPILEYNHSVGISVIGGFVYRGKEIPELYGKYIFGDWSKSFINAKGILFIAEENNRWNIIDTSEISSFVLGFGQDNKKELYVLTSDSIGPTGNSGKVYKLVRRQ
ncbi:PQQ-dependent sugar dehydrogenase [Candidatus Pacearchaeota archaeon]|nr:PQQ-dependent sugar dehydrogenase [Candidatus Pacearchaeota archaeon]